MSPLDLGSADGRSPEAGGGADCVPRSAGAGHPPPGGRRIGLISNPLSRAFREGRIRLGPQARTLPRAEPGTPAELRAALADFAARGVDLLAVQGGDGTLREVLTALPAAFGSRPRPEIALLAAGKTNLAARAVGTAGIGDAGLTRLLEAARHGALRRRVLPVLEVTRPGLAGAAPLRGLLFGAGAFTEAKRLADARLHGRGVHDRLAVGLALAGVALRAGLDRADPLRRGAPMVVAADGGPPAEGRRFLLLATPLDRLMLGLWPFWGEGPGPLHWLDVAAPPRRLGRALLAAWRGRPAPWMPASGYRSGHAAQLAIRLEVPFVLDGEVFEPGPDGVLLSAPCRMGFVAP
ncbi:diacylglycerol kinase family protein [Siccirubricoccus phaeus]|uniref:diacylglycerol kinase family protein n=1 Tax=Siccirubricoccus phaeus TaxID=2595053 RepID=UPI0011F29DE0|nr:diacylglycerol kinase family protein [Siccirubricoccus phaeus]